MLVLIRPRDSSPTAEVEARVHLWWIGRAGTADDGSGMRWIGIITAALALAACGGHAATAQSGPWTVRATPSRAPQPCPASSSRAGWPSRVLALGGDRWVKLWGRRPRLATVDARGHLLGQRELGAQAPAEQRALACGRGGQTAAAWTQYRGETNGGITAPYEIWVDGQVVDTVESEYAPPLAVAIAPDGAVLVAYPVRTAVRAVLVPRGGRPGAPLRLGPASDISSVAAEIGSGGRAVVAWSTIDGGEERNEHRRVYAVFGRGGRFGRAQRVDRAAHRNALELTGPRVRLAVAPNGRALLMWATIASEDDQDQHAVRLAEASPTGRFGTPRQLSADGTPGDVAIRANGDTLAVWTSRDGLHAAPDELITDKATEPRAAFRGGKPYVDWRGGSATRD